MQYITASSLYNYIQCPHRVWRDVYGPQEEKIKEVNPFVQLLWDKGVLYEKEVIKKIGKFTDISQGSLDERLDKTIQAMKNNDPLIYQGVLHYKNLFGIPDLLRRLPDGSYIPVEIKSGMGYEGADEERGKEGKPKKHYAIQLCFYVELLKKLEFTNNDRGIIIDINGKEVEYELNESVSKLNKETWWKFYEDIKDKIHLLLNNKAQNKPAVAGPCKLCPWHDSCKKWCKEKDDLTNIFYLGRNKREVIELDLGVSTVKKLSVLNANEVMLQKKKDKSFLSGVGEKTLEKFVKRADIITNIKKPVIYEAIDFPKVSVELFFDIETDPTQNLVYLYGIYERRNNEEKFISFLAKDNTSKEEKLAWQKLWDYMKALPKNDYAVYHYSPYERTICKKMGELYPGIVSKDEVEEFFDNSNVIDLYEVVCKKTDWPLSSYSIKGIASYLGFNWRDKTPSGALSIQWYNEYLEKKDEKILKRILEYNEDDCKATLMLKDKLESFSKKLKE